MNNQIKLTGLRTNDRIIADSISFITANFRVLIFPLLKLVLPLLLLIMLAESYFNYNYFSRGKSMFDYLFEGSYYSVAGSILSYLLISLFILGGLTLRYRNEEITPAAIIRIVRMVSLPFLILTILFFVSAAFSVILLFIPLLFLYVLYSVAIVELVVKEQSIFAAVRNAHQLLKRNYWKTFWLTMALGLIQFFASFIFEMPSTVYSLTYGLHDVSQSPGALEIAALQFFELLNRFAYVMSVIFWTGIFMQYFNLRERKVGDVLLDQIEEKFGNL